MRDPLNIAWSKSHTAMRRQLFPLLLPSSDLHAGLRTLHCSDTPRPAKLSSVQYSQSLQQEIKILAYLVDSGHTWEDSTGSWPHYH